jgi:hypothetical protein
MSTLIETNCWKINNKSKSIEIDVAFEDTKVTIRIRKSKKNRQHNGQKINLAITTSS